MKYKVTAGNKVSELSVTDFSRGVGAKTADNGEYNLETALNVWYKDGRLTARPALCCVEDKYFPYEAVSINRLKITGTVYYKDGKKYNIAYCSTGDGISYEHIRVFLVSDAQNVLPLGYIPQYRLDSSSFYKPQSVIFIVGESSEGAGIYAFVTSAKLGSYRYAIYEAVSENGEWSYVQNASFYTPTLLLNGRGNLADAAVETFPQLDLGNPETPEQVNVINPIFKSYFTSDGFSWAFYLPEKNLDNTDIGCRVYFDETDYLDFSIPAVGGDTKTHSGRSITAYCNRAEGRVYFMSEGVSCPIPQAPHYARNNIIVNACKTEADGMAKIAGCTGVAFFNSRAYLYGNGLYPNEIYSCTLAHPLYFPKYSKTAVGASNQKIVTAGCQNDKLIVFKEGEIYKVNMSYGSSLTKASSAISNRDELVVSDALSSESISMKVGCMSPETLCACAGQLVWLGNDKKVYTLEATTYGSEKNIFEISEKINGALSEAITPSAATFALSRDGYYYLFVGNKVFVCDCHLTNMGYAKRYGAFNRGGVAWFVWKLPDMNLTSGKNCGEILISACDDVNHLNYIASFKDAPKDKKATAKQNGTFLTEEIPIRKKIVSNMFYGILGKAVKVLSAEADAAASEMAELRLITDKERYVKHIHNCTDGIRLEPSVLSRPTRRLAFELEGDGEISLYGVTFKYKAVD